MAESLDTFAKRIAFLNLNNADQIRALAWQLHTVSGKERLVTADFRKCFQSLHLDPPNISQYLSYLSEGKARAFIRDKSGFRLEAKTRSRLDEAYADEAETINIRNMLSEAVGTISDPQQRVFAEEALRCYSVKAFRATIVMIWNLGYDHLCHWIHDDTIRLSEFCASFSVKYPKSNISFETFESFSDEKEFNVVETAAHARLISKNVAEILKEKLKRRNAAAHPSGVVITQGQADDVITDIILNVVRKLS